MIVLLLSCSNNLLHSQILSSSSAVPSTGKVLQSDTSKVIIPIAFLRDANAKLIERIYLIKINKEQDSIIKLNKLYNIEQSNIIKDFQGRVVNLTNDNNRLKLSNDKYKRANKTLATIVGGAIVTVAGILFLK